MHTSILWIYLTCLGAVLLLMLLAWPVSVLRRNVTLVDSLWGIGFILIAWTAFFQSDGFPARKGLMVALVTLWGLRLSAYLTWRNWGKGEDSRYGSWRAEHGRRFWLVSLFKVFLLQAVVLWIIALPVITGQVFGSSLSLAWIEVVGTLLWTVGMFSESVGDWQLARFKSDPVNRGRVMDRGLWAYTRHPNYFGECLIWWGIFLVGAPVPSGLFTIVSPVLITLVLLKVTGVALTEKTIVERRPAYRDYILRTSAFIPWFPGKAPEKKDNP